MAQAAKVEAVEDRRRQSAESVRKDIDRIVSDAARDGATLRAADVVRSLSAAHPQATVPAAQLAEAVLRAAVAQGVSITVGRRQ